MRHHTLWFIVLKYVRLVNTVYVKYHMLSSKHNRVCIMYIYGQVLYQALLCVQRIIMASSYIHIKHTLAC